jgi:hypothetical protein
MQSQGRGVLNSHLKTFAAVAAVALLIPAGATAKRPEGKPDKGNKHGKAEKKGKNKLKLATVNVKGSVDSNDGTTMVVHVDKASGHAKACKGGSLSFDVSSARFHTADNDASGDADAADFAVGDEVKVRAKAARTKGRKTVCNLVEGSIVAKAVHNRTTPEVDEDDEATDEEEIVEDEESLDDEDVLDDEEDLDEDEVVDEEDLDEDETDVEETDDF